MPAESSLAFFAGAPCRYYVEDLNRFFIAARVNAEAGGDEDVSDAVCAALSYAQAARFDLVLAWDLFSYMQAGAIEPLMTRIARSCRPGTLLFLTTPTGTMIPSAPARMTMTRQGRLYYRSNAVGQNISNPRFSPTALESMMPGFRLFHSFLLGDRMQEFLFSYR
jgi:hypothetical protein